ncbi:MAG: histidine kinase [Clostridia bacterium]|nr:histidine kinase [Clostridia bacterium]
MSTYKQETEITRIITLLSDILSITLDTRTYLFPLQTEIEYLKKYAEILSIRYDNMFTIDFDIDENTLDLSVVKFSLQPILENSVQHGILQLRKNEKIKISAYTQLLTVLQYTPWYSYKAKFDHSLLQLL